MDVTDVADLTEHGLLAKHGIPELLPTMRQWNVTQQVGESYYADGCPGLLARSAAHVGGQILVIFRPNRATPGLASVPPPNHYDALPRLPQGLRT